MTDLRTKRIVVTGGSEFVVLFLFLVGCSPTHASLTITTDDGSGRFRDTREACFASDSDNTYFLVEPGRTGGVLYEPYPQQHRFTQVVGVIPHKAPTTGNVLLTTNEERDLMSVISFRRAGTGSKTVIEVNGRTTTETVSIRILGAPARDGERLVRRVQKSLCEEQTDAPK